MLDSEIIMCTKVSVVDLENGKKKKMQKKAVKNQKSLEDEELK